MITVRLALEEDTVDLCSIEEQAWSLGGKEICASPSKICARIRTYPKGVSIALYQGVACGSQYAFRLQWDGRTENLSTWDTMTSYGNIDSVHKSSGNTGFLVGVGVVPSYRGCKHSHNLTHYAKEYKVSELLITFTLGNLFQDGVSKVIGCARVPWFYKQASMDIEEYCKLCREDGNLFDPVLRFHVRMGAKLVKPVLYAMDDPESRNAGCWVQYDSPFTG